MSKQVFGLVSGREAYRFEVLGQGVRVQHLRTSDNLAFDSEVVSVGMARAKYSALVKSGFERNDAAVQVVTSCAVAWKQALPKHKR